MKNFHFGFVNRLVKDTLLKSNEQHYFENKTESLSCE